MKLNTKANLRNNSKAIINPEGGLNFKSDQETELCLKTNGCFFGEPKYYDGASQVGLDLVEIAKNVLNSNPEFVLKLASYARNEMYLRTTPVVLLVEAANNSNSKKFVRKYSSSILLRADEPAEAISYQLKKFGKPIPNCLKKALADTLHNYDEYQLSKYDKDGMVKLRDVFRLVHPIPRNDEEKELFGRVITRTLKTPETWETVISTKGSTKENWDSIVPKMGYMALLRNLRNLNEKGADMKKVHKIITDEKAVLRSRQYPFRFYSAYKELEEIGGVNDSLDALGTALDLSIKVNVPTLNGITFLSSDVSGSMETATSQRSKMSLKEIGALFMVMANKKCEKAILSMFAGEFATVSISKTNDAMISTKVLLGNNLGGATYGYKAIQYLIDKKLKVDRMIFFTDCMMYSDSTDSEFAPKYAEYKSKINQNVRLYVLDLSGYGSLMYPDDKSVIQVSGYSEKLFDFIKESEKGTDALKKRIDSYNPKVHSKESDE